MTVSPAPARQSRGAPTLLLAVVGYTVNSAAWALVGVAPHFLPWYHDLNGTARAAVVAAPLVVCALVCVPIGALTDSYGARLTFPLVSVVSAGSVVTLALTRTGPAAALACGTLGVGIAAFTVGAAMVARWDRPVRRGFSLSVFGAGIGGAAVGAALVGPLTGLLGLRTVLLLLAAAPAAYAVVAAVLVRDTPPRRPDRSLAGDLATTLRLSTTRYWVALYAITAGSLLAMVLYLPEYLHRQYRLDWTRATLETAVLVLAAALARPVGGRLAARRDAAAVLTVCFAGTGCFGVMLAFQPALPVAGLILLGMAVGLGTAGGALCDLVGRTVPRSQAGLVTGVIGAAGSLAGLVPPLVLVLVNALDGSYTIGFMLLANVAFTTALHLRLRRDQIGRALAYPPTPPLPADLDTTATTVVAVPAVAAAQAPADAVATLADLAAHHELVIVYGHDADGPLGPPALMDALRARLPRFTVTAVFLDAHPDVGATECALLADLLDEGALVVAVVPAPDPGPTAEALTVRLAADTALRLEYDPVAGTRLRTLREPAFPVPAPNPRS
ncbi:MFS transporter [Planosporangium sp. 12N6]|uniref:MFS transporter n=1 Tax=Planosporangium spinosum TaxID=3402278 RepID=UPI003CFB23F3